MVKCSSTLWTLVSTKTKCIKLIFIGKITLVPVAFVMALSIVTEYNRAQANTKKDILTEDENYHSTQHIKRFFLYLAVLLSNFLKIGLQKLKIWSKMAISLF